MGKGIEIARADNPLHADLMDDLKDQLLLVFLKRLGGKLDIPLTEIDNTGMGLLGFSVSGIGTNDCTFHFQMSRKS